MKSFKMYNSKMKINHILIVFSFIGIVNYTKAQTNVYNDVILSSPEHTTFVTALQQTGLNTVLQDISGTYTVFAPDNTAFSLLAQKMGISVTDLLTLPELPSILEYHIMNSILPTSNLNNGILLNMINPSNTIKISRFSDGSIYVNHALLAVPDLAADNGVVHSIDEVVLPELTVFDVNANNGLLTLNDLFFQAELVPYLSDPFSEITVFGPTDAAISDLAVSLGLNVSDLFNLNNLPDLLNYHILNFSYLQGNFTNGDLLYPENTINSLKITKTNGGSVYVNHSKALSVNNLCDNGVVHIIDKGLLPNSTVIDTLIGNNLSTLTSALFKAEMVPTLIDPFVRFTIFAPTNSAFDDFAASQGLTTQDILNLPNLSDILLYHVLNGTLFSADMFNGNISAANGQDIVMNINGPFMVNNSTIINLDLAPSIGVVHIINALLQSVAEINESGFGEINVYPNPVKDVIYVDIESGTYTITDLAGKTISENSFENKLIDTSELPSGVFLLKLKQNNFVGNVSIIKL